MSSDILIWLQQWYHSNCDEHWEHLWGVKIDTLDNPGWTVSIDLSETRMENIDFQEITTERDEHDWIHCRVREGKFDGAGGPFNLTELLEAFRTWVLSHEPQSTELPSS